MRIDQLELGVSSDIHVRLLGDEPLPAGIAAPREVWLGRPEGFDEVVLQHADAIAIVEGVTRADMERLEAICTTSLPRVTWLLDATAGTRELHIQVHTFAGQLTGELPLAIDEKAIDDARRANPKVRNARDAIEWLSEQCLLYGAARAEATENFTRAFLSAGTGRELEGAFAVHGRTIRAFARRIQETDGKAIFLVERIVRGRGPDLSGSMFLAEGKIAFIDRTAAARVRMDVQAQIAQIGMETGGLIDLWARYGQAEADAILQRARQFGALPYDSFEALPDDRIRFVLQEQARTALEEATIGDELEASAETPPILTTVGMTWAEYEQQERSSRRETQRTLPFVGTVKKIHARECKLDLQRTRQGDDLPPDKGVLFISILGDRTRLKRRRDATESIRSASNPMCQLRLLLEGGTLPMAREGRLPALSNAVRRKIFGVHGPTPMQEEALRIALNTPDVALIQGPPGTGKTTVITALVERLNEELNPSDGIAGHILLTGYQHDAVENAIARMSVNGLPPIKFGARGGGDEDIERTEAALERWCQERSAALSARLPARPPSALDEELSAIVEGYLLAPTPREQTAAMLTRVADRVAGHVPAKILDEVRTVRDGLTQRRVEDPKRRELVRLIRALRVEAAGFSDDGAVTAQRLLQTLRTKSELDLSDDEQGFSLLEQAADWRAESAPPFLGALARLRRRLLLRFAPIAFHDAQPKLSRAVLDTLARVRDAVAAHSGGARDAIEEAAAELLAAFQGDPEEVKRSLLGYMAVYAATCQQSERLWSERKENEDPYDTVIVDEAARANPLDLFIPMARAGRRIILVGDHRQLPHVLDRQLEFELERTLRREAPAAAERARELLDQSLFERLFNSLQERHKRGEVQRTVTLDEQYRMPKVLGDFISREFYEPYKEGFGSPLPDSVFAHDLPGYQGVAAAWIDVPRKRGQEKPGQSKSRPVEAKTLVTELKRLIDDKAGAGLNFGVITFYSAQVEEIRRELRVLGMVDEEGAVVEPYRDLVRADSKRVERLRYGTVDAFQGMEFDVVFLSMVRCNNLPEGDEAERRRKYGHLMSPHRLCVSMSRQKRLLIVVGGVAMLREPEAEKAIGPLVRFHRLCEEIRSHAL